MPGFPAPRASCFAITWPTGPAKVAPGTNVNLYLLQDPSDP
jgi:hypothetical protein